jgi:hypothetical protein
MLNLKTMWGPIPERKAVVVVASHDPSTLNNATQHLPLHIQSAIQAGLDLPSRVVSESAGLKLLSTQGGASVSVPTDHAKMLGTMNVYGRVTGRPLDPKAHRTDYVNLDIPLTDRQNRATYASENSGVTRAWLAVAADRLRDFMDQP